MRNKTILGIKIMVRTNYTFGVEGLDDLLVGIEPGKLTLIEGEPGTGKTLLALSIACGNVGALGSRSKYIAVGEPISKLLTQAEATGLPLKEYVSKKLIDIEMLPYLNDPEMIEKATLLINDALNKYDIVIIDSVTPLIKLLTNYPSKRAWAKTVLYDFVSTKNSVLVFVADELTDKDEDLKLLEFVADIVLQLIYKQEVPGAMERFINVKKFRNRDVSLASIPFEITTRGIILLNHLSYSEARKIRKEKKPIEISCNKIKELLPSPIPPGTSIMIVSRITKPFVYTYLMWALGQELFNQLKSNKNVSILTFEKSVSKVFEKIKSKTKELGEKIIPVFLNPLLIDPPKVTRTELEIIKEFNPDILIITNTEKVIHSSQFNESALYRYGMYTINNLVEAGVTTLRYMELSPNEEIPKLYRDWIDIIIELNELPTGEVSVRTLKSLKPSKTRILDNEFKNCVTDERLKTDMQKYFEERLTLKGIYHE